MLQDIEKLNIGGHLVVGQGGNQKAFQLRILCEFEEDCAAILALFLYHVT